MDIALINVRHYGCSIVCVAVFVNSYHLAYQCTIFVTLQLYAYILFFKILINPPNTADLPLLCAEYIPMTLSYKHEFINLDYTGFTALIYLAWFTTKFIKNILECTSDFNIFFVLQRKNTCIVALSKNHKNLSPLVYY